MNRAYAVLNLKALDEKRRTFSGIATTPATDRMGDVVEPKGAKFKLPIPLLWQHDSMAPIGWVRAARVSAKGIEIEGEVADIPEAGALKERLAEAWQSIKAGLVRGLSIGFKPIESEPIDPKQPWGSQRFKVFEWLELSAVTIPANQDASIQAIKSFAISQRAAPGRNAAPATGLLTPGGASPSQSKGSNVKTYTHESLAALQEQRETKAKRMDELIAARDSSETKKFDDEQRAEFKQLDSEIEDLDDEITVTKRHVQNIATAKPVEKRGAGAGRGGMILAPKFKDVDPKFKGEEGLKKAVAHIVSMKEIKQGNMISPVQVAEQMWGKTNPTLISVMKAAVPGGGTDSGEWGAELVGIDNRYTGDFIEYLYGLTVFDRLPLRSVPANVAVKGQDGAWTGYFVGQSKAIKVSAGDFSTANTTPYKAAGLTVVSNEWLTDATPDGLTLVGNGLRNAVAQAVDSLFLSATAVSAGVAPAGILNGIVAIASNGGDAESIKTDLQALYAPFIAAKNTSGDFALVTTPTNGLAMSLMQNALGQDSFPGMTKNGGTLKGTSVFVGDNVGADDMILIKTDDVWRIGDTGAVLSISDSAMIEQDSAPQGATDTPVAASATMVSMFQEDSTAIKVVRRISWGKRRTGAVQWINNAAYGDETS